jgi:NAD(P)-dependent dehydrogenase (short-subunit alcohol dehydrogenase family)
MILRKARKAHPMQKVCIVTGGAGGIGRCIAEEFIKNGYFAAILDTDAAAGEWLAKRYTPHLFFFLGDAASQQTLEAFVCALTAMRPCVDAVIHNACINRGGLNDCGYADFEYVLRLGAAAPFYLTKLLLPYLAKGASIVNISSTRAYMSQANTESYTAAKGAISAMTHAMSVTLAGRARVNAISPGWIDTDAYQHSMDDQPQHTPQDHAQHPAGRIGTPQDIAQMALYLCSEKAGFITGENITVDGGMTKQMVYHNDCGWVYRP